MALACIKAEVEAAYRQNLDPRLRGKDVISNEMPYSDNLKLFRPAVRPRGNHVAFITNYNASL